MAIGSKSPNRTIVTNSFASLGRRLTTFAAVLACSSCFTGCYSYHIYQAGGPKGREMGNQPSTEWKHKTLNAYAWGIVRQDLPVDNSHIGNGLRTGIEEVNIQTNLPYILISAATLGLSVPLDVSWRCAKPPVPEKILR